MESFSCVKTKKGSEKPDDKAEVRTEPQKSFGGALRCAGEARTRAKGYIFYENVYLE
jgi:hypothetical protein